MQAYTEGATSCLASPPFYTRTQSYTCDPTTDSCEAIPRPMAPPHPRPHGHQGVALLLSHSILAHSPVSTQIWKIFCDKAHNDEFARYRLSVERSRGLPGGNSKRRWHGTIRACAVGDNHRQAAVCHKRGCSLCGIIKVRFLIFVSIVAHTKPEHGCTARHRSASRRSASARTSGGLARGYTRVRRPRKRMTTSWSGVAPHTARCSSATSSWEKRSS